MIVDEAHLSRPERDRLNQMKAEYEKEIKEIEEWLTEENLAIIAGDLEACSDIEMISSLWQIYNKQAIKVAIERLCADKRDQINQWIAFVRCSQLVITERSLFY